MRIVCNTGPKVSIKSNEPTASPSEQTLDAHTATSSRTADWIFYGPPGEGSIGGADQIEAQFRYTPEVNWDRVIADDGAANLVSLLSAWSRYNLGYQSVHLRMTVKLRDLLLLKLNDD
jgi:hypothetical protein